MNALNDKKTAKYGINNKPYVICICNNDMFFHEEDLNEALFGNNGELSINLSHVNRNGFFWHNAKPVNTSISAILLFKNTDILTLSNATISVWHNPFAKTPISLNVLNFDEYYYEVKGSILHKMKLEKVTNIFELLSINEDRYNLNPKSTTH